MKLFITLRQPYTFIWHLKLKLIIWRLPNDATILRPPYKFMWRTRQNKTNLQSLYSLLRRPPTIIISRPLYEIKRRPLYEIKRRPLYEIKRRPPYNQFVWLPFYNQLMERSSNKFIWRQLHRDFIYLYLLMWHQSASIERR